MSICLSRFWKTSVSHNVKTATIRKTFGRFVLKSTKSLSCLVTYLSYMLSSHILPEMLGGNKLSSSRPVVTTSVIEPINSWLWVAILTTSTRGSMYSLFLMAVPPVYFTTTLRPFTM